MTNNCDVLNLEWTSYPSRDRITATLVCNYLRLQGLKVIERSIHNGVYYIWKYRPRLVYITNIVGAQVNLRIAKFCNENNIPLITGISEGNFQDHDRESIEQFVWGWNKDHKIYDEITFYWTERTKRYALKYFPQLEGQLVVTGAGGFDNYLIENKDYVETRNDFLKKYGKNLFRKIIGVGCWDFGHVFEEDPRYNKNHFKPSDEQRFKIDRVNFRDILKEIIENNKDILFLLKEHPGVLLGRMASGIDGLEKYDNVIIIRNQESILDCIGISDFWVIYESTTALEAWLMNKQTCLINPSGTDFIREESIYKGSPNYRDVGTLQNAIDQFYRNGKLNGFAELYGFRSNAVENVIEWADGLNHVRAGNKILQFFKQNDLKNSIIKLEIRDLKTAMRWKLKYYKNSILFYLKFSSDFLFFDLQLSKYSKTQMKKQLVFYYKQKLSFQKLKKITGK